LQRVCLSVSYPRTLTARECFTDDRKRLVMPHPGRIYGDDPRNGSVVPVDDGEITQPREFARVARHQGGSIGKSNASDQIVQWADW